LRASHAVASMTSDEVSMCDPLAWLSELYKDREHIKSSIVLLHSLV